MSTGRWTDLAQWRGPTVNQGGPMVEHRGVVLHIAEGSYEGTIAWQRNPDADVSSHFVVSKTGQIAQMVPVDLTAWTQRSGNGHWLSVENEGHTPGSLTDAQVEANAKILARWHQVYGEPLQLATSPTGRGLGHHSMGAESGYNWGHSDCPGPAIKAQKPAILARAQEIINGGDDMAITDEDRKAIASEVWNTVFRDFVADPDGTRPGRTTSWLLSAARSDSLTASRTASTALTAVTQLAGKDFTDEPAIVAGVLAGLNAETIAAAIPPTVAQQVVDLLAAKLQG